MKLRLDLHEIYNRGDDIDRALRAIIDEAIEKKVRLVEIFQAKAVANLRNESYGFSTRRKSNPSTTESRRILQFRSDLHPLPAEVKGRPFLWPDFYRSSCRLHARTLTTKDRMGTPHHR